MQVYNWHKCFRDGHASVNDDLHCRQPSTLANDENIEPVHNVVQSDWQKSVEETSMEVVKHSQYS
jgi:hypothetical protein